LISITGGLFVVIDKVKPVSDFPDSPILRFQFPPIIKGDSKGAKWDTLYDVPGYEPQYQYKGGKPRSMKLETVYVVGGPSSEGKGGPFNPALPGDQTGGWTADDVAKAIGDWKSYFYFQSVAQEKTLPVYKILMYRFLPGGGEQGLSQWRGINYNVKYSDTLITDSTGTYPLISTLTMAFELVSRIKTKDGETQKDHPNIDSAPTQDWY